MVLPKADIPAFPFTLVIVEPTDKRDGRGVVVVDDVLPNLRCGIRDGVVSSERDKKNIFYFLSMQLKSLLIFTCTV